MKVEVSKELNKLFTNYLNSLDDFIEVDGLSEYVFYNNCDYGGTDTFEAGIEIGKKSATKNQTIYCVYPEKSYKGTRVIIYFLDDLKTIKQKFTVSEPKTLKKKLKGKK